MDIFVGNLSFDSTEADIKTLFEKFGGVSSVVIMMREGKKERKSRGFGFVQMPDDTQAQAAIAALNTTEFMGRALTVEIARPKKEKPVSVDVPEKGRAEARIENQERPWQKREQEKPWVSRPGKYKGGRRTRSYVGRHGSTDMDKPVSPWQRNKENPMRWRKDKDKSKPWHKPEGESGSWHKGAGESKPWHKPAGESKPWEKGKRGYRHGRKSEEGFKPWEKPAGEPKPWEKGGRRYRHGRNSEEGFKPWEKPAGESRPWRKAEGGHKPWRKSEDSSKSWRKSEGQAKPWKKESAGRSKSWGSKSKPKTGFSYRKDK